MCTSNACTSSASTCGQVVILVSASLSVALGVKVGILVVGNVVCVIQTVVLEDIGLCLRGQRLVGVEVRSILDAVLGEAQLEVIAGEVVATQRNQAGVHAKQAVVNLNEGRLAGLVINENLVNVAQLLAVLVVCGCVKEVLNVLTHCQ